MTDEQIIDLLTKANIKKGYEAYEAADLLESAGYAGEIGYDDGASKNCVWFGKNPFVIKWSYDDSAKKEVYLYEQAVELGIAFLFPKTELLAEINGIEFIKQEKVRFSAANLPRPIREKYKNKTATVGRDLYRKMNKEFAQARKGSWARDLDEIWAKMVCLLYGRKVCIALCHFVKNHRINDLHRGNVGYINNRPVILDFCGYDG